MKTLMMITCTLLICTSALADSYKTSCGYHKKSLWVFVQTPEGEKFPASKVPRNNSALCKEISKKLEEELNLSIKQSAI